jgi:hypothetical protein
MLQHAEDFYLEDGVAQGVIAIRGSINPGNHVKSMLVSSRHR